jgi:diguanylate cyclase (GGDEF)-like protein
MSTSALLLSPEKSSLDPVVDPARLAALDGTRLMDSPPEVVFDRLTRLAGRILKAPVALVSLVDGHRQFFKSSLGLPEPWASMRQTPLTHSFCQHVVRCNGPLVIPDARRDPLVRENLAIRDLGVIAYLGAPLTTSEGHTLGAFCAIDGQPRRWDDLDLDLISEMATSTVAEVELRMEVAQRREAELRLEAALRRSEALNLALRARTADLADCNARLELLARADGLTGLLNIRAMRLELIDRAGLCLSKGLPLSLLMIDVDHFKAFNDTHGHPAGDDVLGTIAGLIRRGVRQQDLAGRYGGEEFIVGLPGFDLDQARTLADRLRNAIASHPWPIAPVSASIGVATSHSPSDIPSLIQAADEALYSAKRAGRDRVHAAPPMP